MATNSNKKDKVTFLYLGELGFGTKAYDSKMMDGLVEFLRHNKQENDIDCVLMQGGLIPHIPMYYSKSGSEDMRFLGNNPAKKKHSKSELDVVDSWPQEDKEYFKQYIDQKIVNKADAVEAARIELEKLLKILPQAEYHYQHGEEDRKNMEALKELKVNDPIRIKQNEGRMEEKIADLLEERNTYTLEIQSAKQEKKILELILKKVTSNNLKGPKLRDLAYEEINNGNGDVKRLPDEGKHIKEMVAKFNAPEQISEQISSYFKIISESGDNIKKLANQIRETELGIESIKREKEASGFFRVTKRQQLEADEEEALFRMAKNEYNSLLYQVMPKGTNFHVHSTSLKSLDTEVPAEIEIRGINIYLAHNPNFKSDNVSQKTLEDLERIINSRNKAGLDVPDVLVSAHGAGGFQFSPQTKSQETKVKGEYRETPTVAMKVKLPTFQSPEYLEKLCSKHIVNWHTKRFDSKPYAAGAVFHTIRDDGVHELAYIDSSELLKMADIGDQIKKQKAKMKDAKAKEKEGIKGKIKDLEDKIKVNTIKMEVSGDQHIGCANEPGRPSNYQVEAASQEYQRQHGLPKIAILSEVMHGDLSKTFPSNEQYMVDPPKVIEAKAQDIMSKKGVPLKKKMEMLNELYRETLHGIPITHIDKSFLEAKERIFPYLQDILNDDGKVVFVSGNHYNGSGNGRDEATLLAYGFDKKYLDNGQIQIFDGLGESYGSGMMRLENDKVMYSSHKPKKGSKILKSNNDADYFVFFDIHHGGGAFGDNSFIIQSFGKQPWNKYVDAISKYPGLRGIVNFHYDPQKVYGKWELVLDNTLEKLM